MSAFTFSKADHREELVQRLIFKLCVLQLAVRPPVICWCITSSERLCCCDWAPSNSETLYITRLTSALFSINMWLCAGVGSVKVEELVGLERKSCNTSRQSWLYPVTSLNKQTYNKKVLKCISVKFDARKIKLWSYSYFLLKVLYLISWCFFLPAVNRTSRFDYIHMFD